MKEHKDINKAYVVKQRENFVFKSLIDNQITTGLFYYKENQFFNSFYVVSIQPKIILLFEYNSC